MTLRELRIFVDESTSSLKTSYINAANIHNDKNINSFTWIDGVKCLCPDSGFDIFYPGENECLDFTNTITKKIDFKISACMLDNSNPVGYYMYPRSSLSKTSLRLANSVGIIDSGYRGHLCGMFDIITRAEGDRSLDGNGCHKLYNVEKYQRLLQICAPDLQPFSVKIVDSLEDLGETSRGNGGFGSTGSAGIKK